MATIGSLLVNLGMNNAEFKKGIKDTNKKLNKFSRSAKKSIRKISGALKGVTKGMIGLGVIAGVTTVKLISMGSDFEETASKFSTVFAGLEDEAKGFSNTLVDSFGTSQREAMFFLSSIQDLLVPMGVAADKAADLSFETVKLAADIGSFNNQPTAKVMDDISSALTGSFETMKKYGVVLNETVIKQRALEEGLGDSTGKVNAAEKAQLALKIITESSSAAIGDFARTSDGFANTFKIVKSKIEDAASTLGKDFLPQAKEVLAIVKDIIPEMMFLAKVVGTAMVDAFKFITPKIKNLIGALRDSGDEVKIQRERQQELIASLSKLSPNTELYKIRLIALRNVTRKLVAAQGKVVKSQAGINTVTKKSISNIDKLTGVTEASSKGFEEFEKEGKTAFESLDNESQKFATSLEGNLQPIIQAVMTGGIKDVDDLGNAIGTILVVALATATASWIAVGVASSAAGVAMAAAASSFLVAFAPVALAGLALVLIFENFDKILGGIGRAIEAVVGAIKGVAGFIVGIIEEIGQFISGGKGKWENFLGIDIPFVAFADGGISSGFNPGIVNTPTFNAGGTAVAGEAGAEAIIPLKGGAVPVDLNGGGGGGDETIIVNFNVDSRTMQSEQFKASELRRVKLDSSVNIDRSQI